MLPSAPSVPAAACTFCASTALLISLDEMPSPDMRKGSIQMRMAYSCCDIISDEETPSRRARASLTLLFT